MPGKKPYTCFRAIDARTDAEAAQPPPDQMTVLASEINDSDGIFHLLRAEIQDENHFSLFERQQAGGRRQK
jgi:hypothetical protein